MSKNVFGGALGALAMSALAVSCLSACGTSAPDSTSTTDTNAGPDAAPPSASCGRNGALCEVGAACDGPPDCVTTICREGTCRSSAPDNGAIDGDETDVDCGGTSAPACLDGKACKVAADCTSSVCTGNVCQVPTPNDAVKNGTETDVDCGGASGKVCATGQGCKVTADCDKAQCNAQNQCAAAAGDDGIKNGGETGIDCGGTATAKCPTGQGCLVTADCDNVLCNTGTLVCDPPSATDLLKNGNESAVDCGSSGPGANTNAPRCDAGIACAAAADCKSAGCNHKGLCAFARSCTSQHGGTTCGTGDATAAQNQNEDCCASAEVPVYNLEGYTNSTAVRLDKYQITSGRIRRFLDAVSGNVAGWVQANRANVFAPAQLPVALDKFLPTGWTQADHPTDICRPEGTAPADPAIPCNYGALNQVSGYRYNNSPGGDAGYGCYMGTNAYGARTFYMTNAELAALYPNPAFREGQHEVARDRVEQKAMTCTTYFILAAFCAWDGGRLETAADYNVAYGGVPGVGGRTYPWGSDGASRAIGFLDLFSSVVAPLDNYGYTPPPNANGQYSTYNGGLTAPQRDLLRSRVERANLRWNYFNSQILDYVAPLQNRATSPIVAENMINVANDQSVAVAPPGRYPAGEGRYGHRDLIGNVLEITAEAGTATAAGNRPWGRNGSFETAHFAPSTMVGYFGYAFNPLTKYGRAGGRCARPVAVYPATPLP